MSNNYTANFSFIFFEYIWVLNLHVCLWTTRVQGAQRDQQRAVNPWNWDYKKLLATRTQA